jgi:hypothetical protein
MLTSLVIMATITMVGLAVVGIDHANEPAPDWVTDSMMTVTFVLFIAMFWSLAIWAGFSQKPVKSSQNEPDKK